VTNNSTKTVTAYLAHLQSFGVELEESQVITSAEATGVNLAGRFPAGSKIFVLGEEGLRQTIRDYGFIPVMEGNEEKVLAVVVGLDRDFRYADLNQAVHYIQQGAEFIGTNPDRTIPTPEGPAPGAGAIIESIETSCGKKAVLIGKPAAGLYQLALSRSGSVPQETLMIGDRLETDILGAQKLSIRTGLVLSGISSRDDGEKWDPVPDLIAADAMGILNTLEETDGKLV
jgi:4-nitrophenyl phosphatase